MVFSIIAFCTMGYLLVVNVFIYNSQLFIFINNETILLLIVIDLTLNFYGLNLMGIQLCFLYDFSSYLTQLFTFYRSFYIFAQSFAQAAYSKS